MKSSWTTAKWIKAARDKHGDRYDYSRSHYTNANSKIDIVCLEHGIFSQLPRKHLRGAHCPKCAREHANDYRRLDKQEFIRRSRIIHQDLYDYQLVRLDNLNSIVTIICKEHGPFQQRAFSHLKGHGCKKCRRGTKTIIQPRQYDNNWFVLKAKEIHGSKYNYEHTYYRSSEQDIIVQCPKHGVFTQIARDHLRGHGCPQCGLEQLHENNNRSVEEFTRLSCEVHGHRYRYDQVNYVNQDINVEITCPEHGIFTQKPRHHLRGQGCPQCNISRGHCILCSFLDEHGIRHIVNDRSQLHPLEIDIYIPGHKLGLEHHGIYWHSYDTAETREQRHRHYDKASVANNQGILLIQLFENEVENQTEIVKSIITSKLGLCHRIHARKLRLRHLDKKEARYFYHQSHISGFRHAAIHMALSDENRIYCCMSFSRKNHGYEVIRYACLPNHTVVGGPSKLFTHFEQEYMPNYVLSYADRRFSVGNVYHKLGFNLEKITRPNYYYVLGSRLFSRQTFQKHKLQHKLERFDKSLSESENMFLNGYRRIWDAGHYKFLWRR